MNNLMIFENKEVEVLELNGQVLFNPHHVGACLGIKPNSVRHAILEMNDRKRKIIKNSDVISNHFRKLNNRGESFITESGVYDLIFKSRKPEAFKFKDWVTDEVLPSIRRTGGYISTTDDMSDDEIMAKALDIANAKLKERNKKIRELKPKADYTDTILDSKSLFTVNQIAKDYGMGAKKFNELLHNLKIQYKQGEQWLLYAKYQDEGYVFSSAFPIKHSNNQIEVKMTTKWTQKGKKFLYDFLKCKGIVPTIEF